MKVLPTARILIVDSQSERREALREALAVFGVGAIQGAATLGEIEEVPTQPAADVLVVYADDLEQIPENPFRDGNSTPAILIAEVATAALVRAAARGGYDAALGAPLAPRLLYRRIGSVLQRARRVVRTGLAALPVASDSLPADPARPVAQAAIN